MRCPRMTSTFDLLPCAWSVLQCRPESQMWLAFPAVNFVFSVAALLTDSADEVGLSCWTSLENLKKDIVQSLESVCRLLMLLPNFYAHSHIVESYLCWIFLQEIFNSNPSKPATPGKSWQNRSFYTLTESYNKMQQMKLRIFQGPVVGVMDMFLKS